MRRLNFEEDYLQKDKSKDRDLINAQIEEFLARGGKISPIDPGVSGEEIVLSKKNITMLNQTEPKPKTVRRCRNYYYPSLTITEFAEELKINPNSLFTRTISEDEKKRLQASRAEPGKPRLVSIEEQQRFIKDNREWIKKHSRGRT